MIQLFDRGSTLYRPICIFASSKCILIQKQHRSFLYKTMRQFLIYDSGYFKEISFASITLAHKAYEVCCLLTPTLEMCIKDVHY